MTSSEWETLARVALENNIGPLVYYRLKTRSAGIPLPHAVEDTLRNTYLKNSAAMLSRSRDLAHILGSLREWGIRVMVLKGVHLATKVYDNPAIRSMGDVDLLVQGVSPELTAQRLERIGYRICEGAGVEELNRGETEALRVLGTQDTLFEIHWTIDLSSPPFRISVEELWERARSGTFCGVDAEMLSPEDLLLHTCVHAASHHFYSHGLRPLCDVAEVIRHSGEELDWHQILANSERGGIMHSAYLTFKLARQLIGAAVPDIVLSALRPPDYDEEFEHQALRALFPGAWEQDRLSSHFAQLGARRAGASLVYRVLGRVFLPRAALARVYGLPERSPKVFYYYLVRFAHLVARYAIPTLKLLCRDSRMTVFLDQQRKRAATLEWLKSSTDAGDDSARSPKS